MARIYTSKTSVRTVSGAKFPVFTGGAIKISTSDQEMKPKKVLQTITVIEPDDAIFNRTTGGFEAVYFFDQENWDKVSHLFPNSGESVERDFSA